MLLKGQGVSLSGSYQVQRARHYTLYIQLSTAAALQRPIKTEQQSDFMALNVVTGAGFVPFIVQPVTFLMMGYVIVGMRLSGSTLQDAGDRSAGVNALCNEPARSALLS